MEHIVTVNPAWDYAVQVPLPLAPGSVSRAGAAYMEPGGKGVNVASMLKELGLPHLVPTQALIAGDDRFIAEASSRCGNVKKIGAVRGVRVNLTLGPGVAGTDLVGADPAGVVTGDEHAISEEAKVNSPGREYTREDARRLAEEILAHLAPGDTLVLSGSLCPGMNASFYADLAKGARERHAWPVVDASGESLREAWAEAHIATPNLSEARALFASLGDGEACELLEGLDHPDLEYDVLRARLSRFANHIATAPAQSVGGHAGSPQWILLTLGGRGAALIGEGYVFFVPAPPVKVRSTVGAGDAALAGALWARAQRLGPPEWLRWAVACGSAATETSGSSTPAYERICHLVVGIEVETWHATGKAPGK